MTRQRPVAIHAFPEEEVSSTSTGSAQSSITLQTIRGEGVLEPTKGPTLRVVVGGSAWFELEQLRIALREASVLVADAASGLVVRTGAGTDCRIATISPSEHYFRGPEPYVLAPRWFEEVLKPSHGEPWNLANALAQRAFRSGGTAPLEDLVAACVHAISKHQRRLDVYLDRCPGRTRAHQRTVFAKLLRVRAVLDLDFFGEFQLSQMARHANVSRLYFLRLYRDVFGKTPFQEFNDARVTRARTLLASYPGSVTDIALMLGFRNRSAFSRWVVEHCGAPPTELRRPNGTYGANSIPDVREMHIFGTRNQNPTKNKHDAAA